MKINTSEGKFDLSKHFSKGVLKSSVLAKGEWQRKAPPIIIKNIKDTIQRGNSPVQGYGRFTGYSESYKNAIKKGRYSQYAKKLRPVNLTLSGKMLDGLTYRLLVNGFVVFYRRGRSEILAIIHSELGAGKKGVIRKINPNPAENFKKSITKESDDLIYNSLRKNFSEIFK